MALVNAPRHSPEAIKPSNAFCRIRNSTYVGPMSDYSMWIFYLEELYSYEKQQWLAHNIKKKKSMVYF